MVFLLYERAKMRYWLAAENVLSIMQEEEEIFDQTQPKGIDISKAKVMSSLKGDAFDRYLEAMEKARLPERKKEAADALELAERLTLKLKKDLYESRDINDRIYVMAKEQHEEANTIAEKLHYSRSSVYRMIKRIDSLIEDGTK